jgi:predicted dehydrogenase
MANIKVHRVGILMNGVTGRMGMNQHLIRSILAIRQQGGVKLGDTETILPEPVLVGRNAAKLEALGKQHDVPWTTDLDGALKDPAHSVYFDALSTNLRPEHVRRAIAAGKHVYCEKPTATSLKEARELYDLAKKAGVKQDRKSVV